MSDSDHREASEQHWSGSAKAWARAAEEEESGASASATAWMLEAAELHPGERVLELACGAGRVGLQAASIVGPEGKVLCSDFSEAMIEAVNDRVTRLPASNVQTRVLDAQNIDLADAEPFDVVLCRFGYMLMGDPRRAFAESCRVLRPGGRLVLAVWGSAERNPWLSVIFDAVMEHLQAPPPEPGTPGPFALGTIDDLAAMLGEAGLTDVKTAEIETEQSYDSPEAWWENLYEVSGPLAALLDALAESDQAAIREAALAKAKPYLANDGRVVFPALIVGAKARRPG
jgi:SAM-dependent methyltransferase